MNPGWLKTLRETELQCFLTRGFPTRREEAWKYLDLTSLSKESFIPLPKCTTSLPLFSESRSEQAVLVFCNGIFQAHHSHLASLPEKVILLPLSQALNPYEHQIRSFLEVNDPSRYPFASLNTAFLSDGIFLYVPPGIKVTHPIHCIHVNQSSGMWHTRNILILGEDAEASVLEHFRGDHPLTYFHNTVTQAMLEAHSTLHYYKIQQESLKAYHLANLHVHQKAQSHLSTLHATVGGRISRDDLHIKLEGQGSECKLEGFYATQQQQCVDHHILTEHCTERTQSRQHYKGILKDQSRAIFNGKIKVHTHAHHTIAHQSNQNILLSHAAEVDTKPELEIDNEDVQCSHAATVGPLEQAAIFYLQSRGMNQEQATHLLMEAFFNELIEPIPFLDITQKLKALKIHEIFE